MPSPLPVPLNRLLHHPMIIITILPLLPLLVPPLQLMSPHRPRNNTPHRPQIAPVPRPVSEQTPRRRPRERGAPFRAAALGAAFLAPVPAAVALVVVVIVVVIGAAAVAGVGARGFVAVAVAAAAGGAVGVEVVGGVGGAVGGGLRELHVGLGGVVGAGCGAVAGGEGAGVLVCWCWRGVLGGFVRGVAAGGGGGGGVVVGGVLAVGISHGCVRCLDFFLVVWIWFGVVGRLEWVFQADGM